MVTRWGIHLVILSISCDRSLSSYERRLENMEINSLSISLWYSILSPSKEIREVIQLFFRRQIIDRWKKFEFLSPSFNHSTWDCFRHNISSYYRRSSIYVMILPSSLERASILPSQMIFCCINSILSSNFLFSIKMFPNSSLFHVFIFPLRAFNFLWKSWSWTPPAPPFLPPNLDFIHKSSIHNQTLSSQNDLFFGGIFRSMSRKTNQLSQLVVGTLVAFRGRSCSIKVFEIRNLFRWKATWLLPPLRLFHIWISLFISISISFSLSIVSLKESALGSNLWTPPCFSFILQINLKSPC